MKARDIVIALVGMLCGVLGGASFKIGCGPVPPGPPMDAAADVTTADVAAAEAAAGDDAAGDAQAPDAALSLTPAVTKKPAPVCAPGCNAHPCKPGSKLQCFGCGFNGNGIEQTGEQICGADEMWGSCSAGPACSPFGDVVEVSANVATDAGPKPTKCPVVCRAGTKLQCFGCPNDGNNQQMEGMRTCTKQNVWGPCSAGPGCQ